MSFILHRHHNAALHRLHQSFIQEELVATVIFLLFAIMIAVALFVLPAFIQ